MSFRNVVLLLATLFLSIGIVFYFVLSKQDRTFLNILAIVGFLLSVLGIIISYVQILSIKQIATETQKQVADNLRQNNDLLMVSDLSRKVAMVDEIQGYLRDDRIEMCILRMKDLKVILNSLKNHPHYNAIIIKKEFREVFENFNIDLDNFLTYNIAGRKKINKEVVIKNLEGLSTLFLSVEVKLKNIQP